MKLGSEFKPSAAVAILCVGDPGSGKTRLAMSFPVPGVIDCDGNLSSAVRVAKDKKFFFSQPYATDDGKEVPEVDRWNRAVSEAKLMLTNPEIKSIVIDGFGKLCTWGLVHAENELTKAGINVKKEYLAKYMAFIPLMTNFITMLRIPGKYVVINAHQNMERDELMGTIRYQLDIPGRLANTLGAQVTDVWGMSSAADPTSKIGAKYIIRTKPSGYHVNLKTSLDLEPSIDITGKSPDEIWKLLEPRLSGNAQPLQPTPTSLSVTKL